MRAFVSSLVVPVIAAIANYLIWTFLLPVPGSGLLFNLCRAVIAAWAGWRVVARGPGGLALAALAGAVPFLVDHVIIKGGYFLANAVLVGGTAGRRSLLAFGGVCLSYLMFVALPMAISLCGGVAARARKGVQGAPA